MDIVLGPLLQIVLIALDMYFWIIIMSVVLSWLVAFNVVNTQNRFVNIVGDFVHRLTEPLLGRIRRLMPNLGGLDLSPVVLILGLIFVQGVVRNIAYNLV